MKLKEYTYDEIDVGKVFEFERHVTKIDVKDFAELTGDFNPLHLDEDYAKTTQFSGKIVHGMLIGSFFSTLLGMVCPGKKNLYLSQSLNFKKPVSIDSVLIVRGTIKKKIESMNVIIIKTEILCKDKIVVDGEAMVKVLL